MRLIDADELQTAFPCGESIRTESVRATIEHAPTIEPQRKKGHWIKRFYVGSKPNRAIHMYVCSECFNETSYDAETGYSEYAFCPNCGADMRGADDET